MVKGGGFARYNTWAHSAALKELYRRRCLLQEEEMVCHRQAIEILQPLLTPGCSVLDIGCGSGYFYHSFRRRNLPVKYFGLDATNSFIELGRQCLSQYGLPTERLHCLRIDDFIGQADHVVCINVLSNIENFHRPLERMLDAAGNSVLLRESIAEKASYSFVQDLYLDAGAPCYVHVNTYSKTELKEFCFKRGFSVEFITDEYTSGQPKNVIDYPHYWTFMLAKRQAV
jgi:cyclopropane fatty-acyl-phospholipid synthase-like methyltransferase